MSGDRERDIGPRDVLRSVLLWSFAALWTLLCGLFAIATGSAGGARGRRIAEATAKVWAASLLRLSGVPLEVRGLDNIDPNQNYMFISNHQSFVDILALLAGLPHAIAFAAKKELFRVPVFGQAIATLGMVPIDRKRPKLAIESIHRALRRGTSGTSFLFFPEGTRSRTGDLLPFKKGAFVAALLARLPLVPVIVVGARDVLPPDTLIVRPGAVTVYIGSPIPVEGLTMDDRHRLVEEGQRAVQLLLDRCESS